MRLSLVVLFALFCIASSGRSQTFPCSDPEATPIDSFQVTLTLESSLSSMLSSQTYQVIWEIIRYTGTGGTQYVINLPSIHFIGDASPVDSMTASEFFGLLAYASVEKAVALGHTLCPGSCQSGAIAKVSQPACVERVGSAEETEFLACDSAECCTREFKVCCPNGPGTPHIVLQSSSSTTCSCGEFCEPTCPCDELQFSLWGIQDGRR